jgi:hypothetical protein
MVTTRCGGTGIRRGFVDGAAASGPRFARRVPAKAISPTTSSATTPPAVAAAHHRERRRRCGPASDASLVDLGAGRVMSRPLAHQLRGSLRRNARACTRITGSAGQVMRVVAAVVGATTTAASMCETRPARRPCERWPRRRKGLSGSGAPAPLPGSWDRLGPGGLVPGDLAGSGRPRRDGSGQRHGIEAGNQWGPAGSAAPNPQALTAVQHHRSQATDSTV